MEVTTKSVSDRLKTLERRCSRLRLWCALLSAAALTACLSSALRPKPGVIEARSFVVVGSDGTVRAKLESNDQTHWTGLTIRGANEVPLALLGIYEKGGRSDEGAILHLEEGNEDLEVFSAVAGKDRVGYFVTDDHRSVETWVKPGQCEIHFTTKKSSETRSVFVEGQGEEKEPEDTPLLRLDVVGDKSTIEGLTPAGEVLFRQP